MDRHALYVTGEQMMLATEARFVSEQQLHDAIAAFPQLIPHEHFGLGRLTVLAREYPCGAGYVDLVLVDEFGRLVICEIKKGTENADVRRVIAQMLDYGAALWQTGVDAFEQTVAKCAPHSGETLAGAVTARLGAPPEPEAFRLRIEQCLSDGEFVFLYVVRDLDARTERVVEYLTTRPRIPLFVVEVDNFQAGGAALLVPRAVGVPPWVAAARPAGDSSVANPDADALMQMLDEYAAANGLTTKNSATGRRYYSKLADAYIGVYRTSRGTEIGLAGLEQGGHDDVAAAVRTAIRATGLPLSETVQWPMYHCDVIISRWSTLAATALPLYFGLSQPADSLGVGSSVQAEGPTPFRAGR